ALRVERKRAFTRVDDNDVAGENIAGVDIRGHVMPGDAVLALACKQRPCRRIEPRVGSYRPVMKVDRTMGRQFDQPGRQHGEVGDAEEIVELSEVGFQQFTMVPGMRYSFARRPISRSASVRDDGD